MIPLKCRIRWKRRMFSHFARERLVSVMLVRVLSMGWKKGFDTHLVEMAKYGA